MKPGRGVRVLVAVAVVAVTIAYVLPLYVMGITSLKTPLEITQRQYLSPSGTLQVSNYTTALRLVVPSLVNSTIISVTVTALSVFVGGLGGYFLARFRWPITKVIFVLLAIALYLPYQAVLIPLVRLMAATGLALTHTGLILSYLILNVPLAAILMATFFFSVPRELEEVKGSYVALYNLQMAAALMTVVVPLLFFLLLGKYFIRGILAGALRG